ncbi:MAG: efflux RND transporter periplasmic adaptor subunit [Elainellaceae cyanobacterium]
MTQHLYSQDHSSPEDDEHSAAIASDSSQHHDAFTDSLKQLLESSDSEPSKPGFWAGKTGLLIGFGLGIAVGVGVVGSRIFSSPSTATSDTSNGAVSEEVVAPSQSVTLAAVEQAQVNRSFNTTGTVVAYDLLPILPRTSNLQIQQVLVDEGDSVRAGQVMAVLDRAVLDSQLNEAQAQMQAALARVQQQEAVLEQEKARQIEAEAQLRRYQSLLNEGVVSREEFDSRTTSANTAREQVRVAEANINSAQSEVRSQNARIQQTQTQLEQTLVKAPANGLVAERMARVGDVSSNSQALFSIIRDRQLELQVKVPETQLAQVQIGAPVAITSDADARIQLQGRVREIAPLIDESTREATVNIDLPSSDLLRPGMFLRASLVTSVSQGLTIPAAAVLPQSDGTATVFRVGSGDRAEAVTVELGELLDNGNPDSSRIEILNGLNPGDRIVVQGAGYLNDGDRITLPKG